MSDSRLEKFIYAICSMDVSDLPVPLSRIETLWNCLITGETPDFEPLSRNEKYLMAMLGLYELDQLPTPMSRGEKLLYKIVMGETDLSDIPAYLSRYEELLKYLIENGGISEGDFEYVLYTLNQSMYTLYTTAEKPVKSAILKGQTLVNHFDLSKWGEQERITLVADGTSKTIQLGKPSTVKVDTKYLTIIPIYENTINNILSIGGWGYYDSQPMIRIDDGTGIIKKIETTRNTDDRFHQGLYMELWGENTSGQITFGKPMLIEYQDGMENWDIPYFEGMQSVKMPVLKTTGKNLIGNIEWEIDKRLLSDGSIGDFDGSNTSGYINVSNLDMVTFSGFKKGSHCLYDKDKITIGERVNTSVMTIDVSGAEYIRVTIRNTEDYSQSQMEKGSVATTYEPYKSNILTVNEEVELRGIGDVKDELDCLTGEVTQRIGEIVLDGSGNWTTDINGAGVVRYFRQGVGSDLSDTTSNSSSLLCDKFKASSNTWTETNDGIQIIKSNGIYFIDSSVDSLDAFVNKLKATNIKVQYSLIEKPVKTVDLTVVDQDNQPTQLGTFENVTYVSLEAENLIPEVEMEVATRISTELASASPLMDDISTEQQQLNTTVDEQSENVDATMIATTEIFEEIL